MADSTSFEDLIGRVRAGDQDAARELVQRYEPSIRRAVRYANERVVFGRPIGQERSWPRTTRPLAS